MFIKFTSITDISSFFLGCQYYEGQITVSQGRHTVDGRSQLGVYSLDLSSPIRVQIIAKDPETENNFYNFLKKWEVSDND